MLRSRRTTTNMSMKPIWELLMEGLSGIVADWLRFRQRAVKLEQKF